MVKPFSPLIAWLFSGWQAVRQGMLLPWHMCCSSAWWLDTPLLLHVWVAGSRTWVFLRDKNLGSGYEETNNWIFLPFLPSAAGQGRAPLISTGVCPACPYSLSFTSTVHREPVAVMCFWKFRGRWKIRWKFALAFWAQPAGHSVNLEGLCMCQQDGSAESSADSALLWG